MNKLHYWPEGSTEVIEQHPTNIVWAFFANYDLPGVHDLLWMMMKEVFINSDCNLIPSEREDFMELYEHLHQLLTALSVLYSPRS